MLLVDGSHVFPDWRQVHHWADAVRPERMTVAAQGTHVELGFGWTVPVDMTVTGTFFGGSDSPGWWLSYRAATTLTLDRVDVSGYGTGGIDYGDDADRRYGLLVVRDSVFTDIGGGPGYAAVYATHADVEVTGTRFRRLTQDPKGALLHGVYLGANARGIIRDCRFQRISGDAIRVRNGSSVSVSDCTFRRTGVQAAVSAWRLPTEDESTMTTQRLSTGKTYDGSRKLPARRTIR